MGPRGRRRLGRSLARLLRLWRPLLRWRSRRHELLESPCVLAFWHGRLFGVLLDSLDSGAVSMSSRSRDGELSTAALTALGIRVARGSSSRGGHQGLREMRAFLAAGAPFAGLTVDGPRGPWREVQPGAIFLARWLGIPVVPATFSCRRSLLLSSWDRLVLPLPGTQVVVAYGDPIPPQAFPSDLGEAAGALRDRLDELTLALDLQVAGRDLWGPHPRLAASSGR